MPCLPRHLSDDFLRLLVPGGPLNFLIAGCPQSAVPDHYAVDMQLRAGNTIQYYHGPSTASAFLRSQVPMIVEVLGDTVVLVRSWRYDGGR